MDQTVMQSSLVHTVEYGVVDFFSFSLLIILHSLLLGNKNAEKFKLPRSVRLRRPISRLTSSESCQINVRGE